jgi:hypothetical protein
MIAQGLIKMGHPAFHAIPTAAAVPNSAKWPSKAMMNSPPPRCLPATSLADYQRVARLGAD